MKRLSIKGIMIKFVAILFNVMRELPRNRLDNE